jgi:hypothetical protein
MDLLNSRLGTISLSFGAAGSLSNQTVGVGINYSKGWDYGKNVHGNASASTNSSVQTLFVPAYSIRKGVAYDLNTGQIANDIKPHALKTLDAGANFSIVGGIPVW